MLNPHGHGTIIGDQINEHDTFMCGHCGKHTQLKPYERPTDVGGWCSHCTKAVCKACAASGKDCFPIEKILEKLEKDYYDRTFRCSWV